MRFTKRACSAHTHTISDLGMHLSPCSIGEQKGNRLGRRFLHVPYQPSKLTYVSCASENWPAFSNKCRPGQISKTIFCFFLRGNRMVSSRATNDASSGYRDVFRSHVHLPQSRCPMHPTRTSLFKPERKESRRRSQKNGMRQPHCVVVIVVGCCHSPPSNLAIWHPFTAVRLAILARLVVHARNPRDVLRGPPCAGASVCCGMYFTLRYSLA